MGTPAGEQPPTTATDDPLPVAVGGLMRCCTHTYAELAPPAHESSVGDIMACLYCPSQMAVAKGPDGLRWEWDQPGSEIRRRGWDC